MITKQSTAKQMIKTKQNNITEETRPSLKTLVTMVENEDAIFGEIVYLTKEEIRIYLPKHEVTETLSIEWINDDVVDKLKVGEKYFIVETFKEPVTYELSIYSKEGYYICDYLLSDYVEK